jgi:putative ABC transport system permease protein
VILKTLGATRRRIVTAFALEYLILALATALFAIAAGAVAAWYVLTAIMQANFTFLAGPAVGVVAVAVVLTLGLGLAGTWRILAAKPAPVLRDL